ncbi:MAG TPA: PAS domain-containing protein [Nocardioides sp.]|nr:PAS domain-containing protein [Nocardioides sp.]
MSTVSPPHEALGLDAVPVALLVSRRDGSVLAVNRAWCELTLLPEEESLGLGWLSVVDRADRAGLLTTIAAATRADGTAHASVVAHVDGRALEWHVQRGRDDLAVAITVLEGAVDAHPSDAALDGVGMAHPPAVWMPSLVVSPPEIVADGSPESTEMVAKLVHDIYAASLGVASYAGLLDEPPDGLLHRAINELDRIIDDIRLAAARRSNRR